ncbi:MAG: hypothetical protein PHF86_12120 [Candidatus Nanoarchaeia archaeon]|nr:hypothetical protein [Candidatus Nanoarchaeia archaeon]
MVCELGFDEKRNIYGEKRDLFKKAEDITRIFEKDFKTLTDLNKIPGIQFHIQNPENNCGGSGYLEHFFISPNYFTSIVQSINCEGLTIKKEDGKRYRTCEGCLYNK